MRTIKKKHQLYDRLLSAVVGVAAVALGSAAAGSLRGFDSYDMIWLTLWLGLVAVLGTVVITNWYSRMLEADFDKVPLMRCDQLRAGERARVQVTVQGPGTLTAALQGTACVYYQAAAVISNTEGEPEEIASVHEGSIAAAADVSGAVLLDLSSGIELIGTEPLHTVHYEYPRTDDPLRVGISEPYLVDLRVLRPGDQLEAVGTVGAESGTPALARPGKPLLVRMAAK